MTNEEFASYAAGYSGTVRKDTLQEKIDKLSVRTAEKVERLGTANTTPYTQDTLIGMSDADTFTTKNAGYSRELDPYGNRLDAVEVVHGNVPYDMQGISKARKDAGEIGKSEYAMQMQKQQVATIFNKPVDQVTQQDMIDVANQQQVQKLADLARTEGEERWIAPLAIGSAPINLSGKYVDEFGLTHDNPLNVPIMSKKLDDVGSRGGIAVADVTGNEVSAMAALDPTQNAFANSARPGAGMKAPAKVIEKSLWDKIKDVPQAFLSGAGKSAYDMADTYTEIAGDLTGKAVGLVDESTGKKIDKLVDLGTDDEKTTRINNLVNYDNSFSAQSMAKVGRLWDEAVKKVEFLSPSTWGNIKGDKLIDAAKAAFADPETAAYSLGYMAPALAGVTGKAGARLVGGVVKSHLDDTAVALKAVAEGTMTKEAAMESAKKSVDAMSKADRTKLFLVENADALNYGAMMNNDQMDDYIKANGGEDATLLRNIVGTAANAVGMKFDMGSMNAILKPTKRTPEIIGEFLKGAGEDRSRAFIGAMAELSTKAAIAGLHEAPQEWGQSFIEGFNKVYGTKGKDGKEVGVEDSFKKATRDASVGAISGLAGAVHTSLGVNLATGAVQNTPKLLGEGRDLIKKGVEYATETPEQRIMRQNAETSAPIKEEAINAILNGNIDDAVTKTEQIHGKLGLELDESAPKSHTYGNVIKESLARAIETGDEAKIDNVYKAMAEMDKNKDVDFAIGDLVKESSYIAAKKLMGLINQNADSTDEQIRALKGEVGNSIAEREANRESINQEIATLKTVTSNMRKKFSSVMGSDALEPLTRVEELAQDYLDGKKSLNDVNKEFAELGFMDSDGKADPNRPGLAVYERELTAQMLNTRTSGNLLNEKVTKGARVKLTGLTAFAESRLKKLHPKIGKEAYQTSELINNMKAENERMLSTVKNVLSVAKKLKNVSPETKTAYEAELHKAAKAALDSSNELDRRAELLAKVVKPDGVAGALAFQVDKDGESIQAVTYKDGKPVKTKIAEVVDGKVVPIEKYAESKAEVVEPVVEVKEPVETVVEPVKAEVIKEQEVDLSNLSKADRTFIKNYKSGRAKLTAARTERYNRLMELAKQPKVKKESQARKIKAAAEVRIGEGEEEAAARVKVMFKPEDEVKTYAKSLSDEDIAEQTRAMEENQKIQEQLYEEEFQKFSDSIDEIVNRPEDTEETAPVDPKGPLATVRESIAKVDVGLSQLIAGVEDMDVKRHVKEHYAKKLSEIQADKTRLGKMIDRLEAVMAKRLDRKYDEKSGNIVTALVSQIDSLVKNMLTQLARLEKMLKKASKQYRTVAWEMNKILAEIGAIEAEYTSKPVKTTIGTVVKIDEALYGTPVVEVDGKRVAAERQLTKKSTLEAPATAINRALNKLAEEKMDELRVELKEMEKGKTSLGAKLLGRLLINFPMSSPIHRILKRGEDSVFGQLTGNTFAKADRLLEVLPKGFKEFFITDDDSKQSLLENFATMAKYIKDTKIGDIVIGKNRIAKHIDQNGLVMMNVDKDGKTYNFPVDIIELLGTVVDGKLQLDEQTQNILKFYSAKMLVDTQKMVGLILSLDESEMGQVLGIYDAEEQLKVKQEAMEWYINSASIRKDIGDEVYQALGLKFNELAPEFTVESFKSALGVLVQAIAVENGSMVMKATTAGGKNQNLVKTNWDSIGVDRNALTKAISKLQYLNENRNRPLPGLKQPADDNNRVVMNTQNPMDEKSSTFLNKQEKIAYKISPRLARWLAMDEAEVLKAMGYMDVKNAGLHVSEIDAQMARNDKLVREWEILKTFAKSVGDKKFYLKWGQTVSGRFTILNDLNYQESKLHREFVVAEGSTESVDVNDKDARQMLEASILQGLDMDPDKLSPETASEKFNKLFKVTDKGIEVVVEGPIKMAYEAMKDGKVDAEAMAEVFADSEGHHGISSIELLVAWDEAIKSGKKLETHANLEIDAITSGMILTLLQIGSDVALRMAEKGGIYTAERLSQLKEYVEKWLPGVTFTPGALIEAGKKNAAEIEGKMKTAKGAELVALRKQLEDDAVFKDLYSTIGVAMIGEVQAYKEKLMGLAKPNQSQLKQLLMLEQIGELNLKNIRSIAKSPVMVYIYGATVGSIKKKLTYSLGVDTLVKALKNASKLLKDGKDASAEMNFINGFLPENEWKFVNEFGAKIEKPTEMWEQLLAVDINGVIDDIGSVINATFGKAIETAFDSRLGFVNKNRDTAKSIEMLVFQSYQIRLADEVQKFLDVKYGVGRHKGESYKLSKDDMQNINQKLADQGYGHNIVWYEDGKTINQSLNKTDTKGGIHSSKVTVGNTSVGGQIKQFKPAVNTGAAPTISVHAIDGRMMLDVLNREIGGKYTGGNIYDAVVLSVNKAMLTDTADSYNTNMIETGFSRSVIADQLEMLENMFYIKDEAGNKQFDEDTFNKVLASIGLRPEGDLREDYTKEANRIGLGIGKMLESLERAESINAERLANSGKEFHSGHLYQMGSGVVKVDAANTRAKQFPAITTIKRLLTDKLLADRKVTHKEFAKAGVKLHKDTDYVVNLDDAVKGSTQITSKANIVQIKTVEDTMTATNKLWGSLGSNDTVQIIGSKASREWLESEDAKGSSKYWADKMLTEVLKSGAKIVANGFDDQLKKSGRAKVDGVWMKNETTSDKNLNTTEDGNSIYTKLGDKTEVGNVKIVKNIFANKYDKNIITAFRVDKKLGLLESFNKYNAIGNPIDWQKFEPRFKNDNATKAFIDWFLGNDYKELEQDYRQALLNSLDALKGKKIEYYKELGRPSHATALDYLVNIVWVSAMNKLTENEVKSVTTDKLRPEFDKLPKYTTGQKTMTYAGIGSRETPAEVLILMTKAAKWLEAKGYKLQTGKTFGNREEGADKAFSDGTNNKELFGPEAANEKTIAIAKEMHPAPQHLKEGGLKLMARNTNQVFGVKLDTPVDFVLFYAEETKGIRPKGGTGQAVEMARLKGIPTINMANSDWKKQLTDVLKSTKTNGNEGKADTQEEISKINSVQYVQDKIAPWIELDEITKRELAKITDKNALDKIAEDMNCRKG